MSFTRSRHPHSTVSKTEVSVSTAQRPTEDAQLAASNRILQRLVAVCLMVVALVFFSPLIEQSGFPAFSILNGFLGASLQALAFLVVGVLASSAVQVFVSDKLLQRIFPHSVPGSIAVAALLSLILPVCDCSSIPLFRSLVIRKVPLPAAVTFLLAAPVANPLVVWSTYFAFNADLKIVLLRSLLGLAVAAIVGLSMTVKSPVSILRGETATSMAASEFRAKPSEDFSADTAADAAATHHHSLYDPNASFRTRLLLCFTHVRADFFDIARYLIVGIAVASIFKNLNAAYNLVDFSGMGIVLGILVMMLAAFVLSLCSSSDAVVGRIFAGQMPTAPVLSFLVFGPMIDIKNVLMLSAYFTRGFMVRVAASAFVVTGIGTLILSATGVLV